MSYTFKQVLDEKLDDGIELKFSGLQFLGDCAPLDTVVECNFEATITWADREKFFEELKSLIEKYKI